MKSCFEELHTFLSMQGYISSLEARTQEADFKEISKKPRDFMVKQITFLDNVFSLVMEKCL